MRTVGVYHREVSGRIAGANIHPWVGTVQVEPARGILERVRDVLICRGVGIGELRSGDRGDAADSDVTQVAQRREGTSVPSLSIRFDPQIRSVGGPEHRIEIRADGRTARLRERLDHEDTNASIGRFEYLQAILNLRRGRRRATAAT